MWHEAQPGTTFEDIAVDYFDDPSKAQAIREANPAHQAVQRFEEPVMLKIPGMDNYYSIFQVFEDYNELNDEALYLGVIYHTCTQGDGSVRYFDALFSQAKDEDYSLVPAPPGSYTLPLDFVKYLFIHGVRLGAK